MPTTDPLFLTPVFQGCGLALNPNLSVSWLQLRSVGTPSGQECPPRPPPLS